MYDEFAAVYDRLMDDVDYGAWAALYARLLAFPPEKRAPRVVECGCGTGSMTLALARLGFEMTGIDSSPAMLALAMEKLRAAGFQIPFIRQDMRRLALHRPMDAVIVPCDGLNYLLRETDLAAFFSAAANALLPGGRLVFDLSSRFKLLDRLAGQFYGEEREDLCYLWQNRLLQDGHTVEMDLTFFAREADGRYRRFFEHQHQRAWEPSELQEALEQAGFGEVQLFGPLGEDHPGPEAERYHLSATKMEE